MEGNSTALANQVCQQSDEMLAEKLRSGKDYLPLATDGWEAVRVRVAQLFRKKEFAEICKYYMSLRVLTDYIQEHRYQSDKTDLNGALERAKDTRSRAKITITKYQEIRLCILIKRYKVIDSEAETPRADPSVTGAEN